MDYAKEKYDSGVVEDVKCLLKVLWMYLPLPMFWALFDQLVSLFSSKSLFCASDLGLKPSQFVGISMDLPSHTDERFIGLILDQA